MELSQEDALRLNVLMANQVEAIRIDESTMTVHGLLADKEAAVKLHPTGRPDQYLRLVRELLAGHAIGSPGGYPVYLQRWTRMGQAREQGLDRLLLLGESEAVVSVAYSPGVTDELARRAWWAMPVADNALRMLERAAVAQGQMGPVLAGYLVDHLPFEQDPQVIINTVRAVLQPGLLDEAARQRLWNRGRNDNAYYIGFLERLPDALPAPAKADREAVRTRLQPLAAEGNPFARQLDRVLSAAGQTFLDTCGDVLRRPANQDVVKALLNAIGSYFGSVRPCGCTVSIEAAVAEAQRLCEQPSGTMQALLSAAPELAPEMRAMLVLSRMDAEVAMPVLSRTTAIGSLMRRKLEPITGPLLEQLGVLRGKGSRS